MMRRKPLYYYTFRGGEDLPTPVNPAPPVKVMLVNEWNGSAAETGAFMFKLGKVGTLVGKRTLGGGIGPYFFTPDSLTTVAFNYRIARLIIPTAQAGELKISVSIQTLTWKLCRRILQPDATRSLKKLSKSQCLKSAKIRLCSRNAQPFRFIPESRKPSAAILLYPVPGSAFSTLTAKQEVKTVSDGKFASYIGQFETPMGLVSFSQEGDKLIGLAGGERIELSPDAAVKDNFKAQSASVSVTFERDPSGKIVGLAIVIPSGREMKGKKIN
jgi:hypothetical protein